MYIVYTKDNNQSADKSVSFNVGPHNKYTYIYTQREISGSNEHVPAGIIVFNK